MAENNKSLAEVLLECQRAMPNIVKDSENPHFKSSYISLGGLLDTVLPILNSHGVLLMQLPSFVGEDTPALTTTFLRPSTGEEISSATPLWSSKQDAQGQGGAITYMRRYALMSALGLVADEDDDGNYASSGSSQKKKAGPGKKAAASTGGDSSGDVDF